MENNSTLKALQIIRSLPKFPEKPHWPGGSFVFKEHPFVKPSLKVLEYFKAISQPLPLNSDGEVQIHKYMDILDIEGIRHTPLFMVYDARVKKSTNPSTDTVTN